MPTHRKMLYSRRRFLRELALAGTAGILGLQADRAAAEPPPETTTLRLPVPDALCFAAPQYLAEPLLKSEGFSDVQFVQTTDGAAYNKALSTGEVHFAMTFAGEHVVRIDTGDAITLIAGLHVGCYELFATDQIRTIRDLRGKSVAVTTLGSGRHIFLASILAHVGLDIRKDVRLVTYPSRDEMRLLAEGKIDAFMAFPPEPQELRAKKIGHVLVNTAIDRPWSHYFCCTVAGNREFVRKHPVATQRTLRALLKAADICASAPSQAAQMMVKKGAATSYEYALQSIQEIPYARWRDYDPEDSVRFYALRLRDVGMIGSIPQKIIAQGTDWRFLKQLKLELKA